MSHPKYPNLRLKNFLLLPYSIHLYLINKASVPAIHYFWRILRTFLKSPNNIDFWDNRNKKHTRFSQANPYCGWLEGYPWCNGIIYHCVIDKSWDQSLSNISAENWMAFWGFKIDATQSVKEYRCKHLLQYFLPFFVAVLCKPTWHMSNITAKSKHSACNLDTTKEQPNDWITYIMEVVVSVKKMEFQCIRIHYDVNVGVLLLGLTWISGVTLFLFFWVFFGATSFSAANSLTPLAFITYFTWIDIHIFLLLWKIPSLVKKHQRYCKITITCHVRIGKKWQDCQILCFSKHVGSTILKLY